MALTATYLPKLDRIAGAMRETSTDITFDSSYNSLGESLTPRQIGLNTVINARVMPYKGYAFEYDIANQKILVKRPAPVLVDELTGAFSAGVAYTLKYLPGYILGIRGLTGSTGSKRLYPKGETLGAGTCSLDWTTGVITWGDAGILSARIVYVPLGTPGFTSDLLVVDEASPIATNVITPANQCAAIQYVWNDEDNEILNYVPVGESPSGAQCAIDIDDGAGATKITVTTGRIADGTATKLTYLKRSGNPLRFVDQADRTVTSDVVGPATDATFDIGGLVLPGYGQCIVGETGAAANLFSTMLDADGSTAANVAVFNPWRNTITFANGDAYATAEIPLLYPLQSIMGAQLLEVPSGTNLAALSGVRLVATGY